MAIDCSFLQAELAWLDTAISQTMKVYFEGGNADALQRPLPRPDQSPYGTLVTENGLGSSERAILILALARFLQPALLDPFMIRNPTTDRYFSEFGGHCPAQGPFEPSIETALFLLSGGDLGRRLAALPAFDRNGRLFQSGLLGVVETPTALTTLSPAPGIVRRLVDGTEAAPPLGAGFPAQLLETRLAWDELVLAPQTRDDIEDVVTWVEQADAILQNAATHRRLDRGLRALFTGPPGTGKTLTATLLGKRTGRPVYRVDLSRVVSKWIGETEKNLATLFALAEGRDWILFFDEADALFSGRSDGGQANDRHANQEVSYLLQRIERFDGTAILATNLKRNIDPAFIRRFQPVIRFDLPGPAERKRLWAPLLADADLFAPDIDAGQLAKDFKLTGATITNVFKRALIETRQADDAVITEPLLRACIARELIETGERGPNDR